uniref:G-protein coupled receptors family 1 profile domain-containing protein n=1 Tax=Plectus sambesii TaxID=2011161 RepID=A0A914X9W6_9BILA
MAVQLRNRTDGQWEQVQPQAVIDANMRNFIIYGIEGLLMTLTNLPIVLSVLRYKALHDQKEFIIVAGLAFADGFNGFAFLVAAIGRINQLLNGDAFVLKSRWHCGTTVWNICWTFANNLAGLMLLVVSIDRLLAVSFPIQYFTFTKRYACILVGSAFAYICIPATVSFVLSYQYQDSEFPAYCLIGMGMHDGYYDGIPSSSQTPFYMMLNVNAMVNILIYMFRFKEMRNGLKALIMCRTKMPATTVRVHSIQISQRNCSLSTFFSSKRSSVVTGSENPRPPPGFPETDPEF